MRRQLLLTSLFKICCLPWTNPPKIEYTSAVWDPHLLKDITTIERVQRIAARWVKSNYNWENCVSNMLSELQWPSITHSQTYLKTYNTI